MLLVCIITISVIFSSELFNYRIYLNLFVPCRKFRLPYLGKAQQQQEQRYPFLSVCAAFSCVQTALPIPISVCSIFLCPNSATRSYQCVQYFRVSNNRDVWVFVTCSQMVMHAIARAAVRGSALEVDSGRKISRRIGDSNSNPRQYSTWLFNRTLYRLGHVPALHRLFRSPSSTKSFVRVGRALLHSPSTEYHSKGDRRAKILQLTAES